MYCKVAVPIPVDQLYTYKIPEKFEGLVSAGSRVYINLKNMSEPSPGYVVEVSEKCDYDPNQVKPLYDIVEGAPVPPDLMELSTAIADKYICARGMALEMIFPPSLSYSEAKIEEFFDFNRRVDVFEALKDKALTKNERLIVQYLYNSGASTAKEIEKNLISTMPTVKNNLLKLKNLNYAVSSRNSKNFKYGESGPLTYELGDEREFVYTDEQEKAIEVICKKIEKNEYSENLIFGVTGSGKTEVYIEILKKIIALGKSAIVLVPEIALTEHLKHRYQKVFPDILAIWHSLVTKSQKDQIYSAIADGKIRILLGARSAIFAPFDDLGCVVIDEEHDSSYKQDSAIRYDTRDIARMRLKIKNGTMVLGTATPSVETYHRITSMMPQYPKDEPPIVRIEKRVENRPLPVCSIVDMGREFSERRNKSIFSGLLSEKLEDRLLKRQQSLLFLNRRGHSTFVLCRSCGHVVKCDECSVSMTYHMEPTRLLCHYCALEKEVPSKCPKCESPYIRFFGAGTEKVEEEFKLRFPRARVARLDSDVLTNKKISAKILDDFHKKKTDVLIGTQMISKGFDFHNITLVGVISADTMLNMPDMFATERTFQVLCQVIGRTGRGELEGECVIQTYNPDNYAVISAAASDFKSFYAAESVIRQGLFYPPFSKMIKISYSHQSETSIIETASEMVKRMEPIAEKYGGRIRITGPAPALVPKIQNIFRYNVFIFADSEELIRESLFETLKKYSFTNKKQCVKISIDVSPVNTY